MICPVCCLEGFDELPQQFDVALAAKSTSRKCRAPLINHLFPPSKRMEKPMGVGQNDDQSIMTGINFPS